MFPLLVAETLHLSTPFVEVFATDLKALKGFQSNLFCSAFSVTDLKVNKGASFPSSFNYTTCFGLDSVVLLVVFTLMEL